MRWLIFIFALLLAGQCCAGGVFTITDVATADCDMAGIRAGYPLRNDGVRTIVSLGDYYGGDTRILLRFNKLADSMKQVVVDSGGVTWDSAKITLYLDAYGADDTVCVSTYKVLRTRVWVEGVGDQIDTCGVCWDSANAMNYGVCSGSPADWGTDGCKNTTTDRSGVRETVGSHADSVVIVDIGYADVDFFISSATITDTLGGGLIFIDVFSYPAGSRLTVVADDYATAGWRPEITVWYTKIDIIKMLGRVLVGKCEL